MDNREKKSMASKVVLFLPANNCWISGTIVNDDTLPKVLSTADHRKSVVSCCHQWVNTLPSEGGPIECDKRPRYCHYEGGDMNKLFEKIPLCLGRPGVVKQCAFGARPRYSVKMIGTQADQSCILKKSSSFLIPALCLTIPLFTLSPFSFYKLSSFDLAFV